MEENPITALAIQEPDKLKKLHELRKAIEDRKVADPFTIAGLTITVGMQIQAAFLAASLAASYLMARSAHSKTPPQQQGKLSGTLQVQNSAQGIFIPEIYGAAPVVTLVTGSNPTWTSDVHDTTGADGRIYKTSGTDQVWNSGAVHNTTVTSEDAFISAIFDTSGSTFSASAIGFSVDDSPESGGGIGSAPNLEFGVIVATNVTGDSQTNQVFYAVINGVPQDAQGIWGSGDEFRVEKRNGVYRLFHNYAEITSFTPPTPSGTLYLAYGGWRTGYGLTSSKVQIGDIGTLPSAGSGGCKVPAIIVWTSGIRKHQSTSQQSVGGKGSLFGAPTTTVQTTTYDMDIALMFCRGPVSLILEYANTDIILNKDPNSSLPTGSYDGSVGADPDYDFDTLPDPQQTYLVPVLRNNAEILDDPGGGDGGSGSIQSGGSSFAVYPGDSVQLQDPTIQAAIDTAYGSGSTSAYRGRSLIVHSTFSLSKWSGLLPNFVAVWQHKTLKTLDDIFASFFPRIGLMSYDYDFTGIPITCRGLLISGRQFAPAEIMDTAEMYAAYNYFITEAEGQIVGYINGDEPSITIDESEIGWLDGESEIPDIVERMDGSHPEESTLEKEIDFRYIDPGFDWDSNMQIAQRRVTNRISVDAVELHCTLTPDEAREAAQRLLYFNSVSSVTRSFTLPWTYLYIYPGYRIIVNGDDGLTYTIRLTDMRGGVGVLECNGFELDPAMFDQSAVGVIGPTIDQHNLHPAQTVMVLWDGPSLRDSDAVQNDSGGLLAAGVPRTNSSLLTWTGDVFYIERNNEYQVLGSSTAPATLGKVISYSSISGSDPTVFNTTATITVDLYGTSASLSSVTEVDITNDETTNLAVIGGLAFNFTAASQVGGYPNRWDLSGSFLFGIRETNAHLDDTFTDALFLLIDGAVVFCPMKITDLNNTFNFRAVTVGQSLSDAATISFPYSGGSLQRKKPTDLTGFFDEESGDLLIAWSAPDIDATSVFDLEITNGLGRAYTISPDLNRHLQEYVIWDTNPVFPPIVSPADPGDIILLPYGGIEIDTSTETASLTDAEIVGGFLVEFQITDYNTYVPMQYMTVWPITSFPISGDDAFMWQLAQPADDPSRWYVYPEGFAGGDHDDFRRKAIVGDRLAIYIRPDGVAEYHINYSPSSKPIYISGRPVDTTTKYKAGVHGLGRVEKVSWLRQGSEFKYLSLAQRIDFGLGPSDSLPGEIDVRVRQRSSNTSGPPSDWLEGAFAR